MALARAGHADPDGRRRQRARAARCASRSRATPRCRRSPSPRSRRRSPVEVVHGAPAGRTLHRDLATGRTELVYDWDVGGRTRLPNGLEVEDSNRTTFSIVEGDPLSARVECRTAGSVGRGRVAHALRDRRAS